MTDELPISLQQLKDISKELPDRLDDFILEILEAMYKTGLDIATFAMPVIIQFQIDSLIAWEKYGIVLDSSRTNSPESPEITLRANPENLSRLMLIPDVKKIEAYRKKRASN